MKNDYVKLSEFGVIAIQGEDTLTFLQGQVTNDMREVQESQTHIGAICDVKGRAIVIFHALKITDGFLFAMPDELIETVMSTLKKYIFRSKVTIQNISDKYNVYGQCNSQHPILISSDQLTCELELAQWKQFLFKAKVPTIYQQTSSEFLPHHINLQNLSGVSFTKGCYTGQEIIARMEHLGKLKQQMQTASANNIELPKPNTKILLKDNKTIAGYVVDSTAIENNIIMQTTLLDRYISDPLYVDSQLINITCNDP